ncbi:hypothetical protein SAMN05660662_2934 [Blastococcus aurantiacus]|uniref:Right handed beta helix region n=1 Tax=Blastococcus aurantiacus TaxID=1550231 RepID=A0A1G7MUX6_9ACTN|nr:hypothetical protein [Blastococcus aurantiacus]SDF65466.1 hypothetical protein SAMN05660662_2934 [Blastococcus aurantiacus]
MRRIALVGLAAVFMVTACGSDDEPNRSPGATAASESAAPTPSESTAPTPSESAAPTPSESAAPTPSESAAPTSSESAAPTDLDGTREYGDLVEPQQSKRARGGPENTGHRVGALADSDLVTIKPGERHVGKRFTKPVRMTGGAAVDSYFAAGLLVLPGDPVNVSWSTIRGGLGVSSHTGGRFSNLDIRDLPHDGLHITSDRGQLARDLVFDTCWVHGFQPAAGAHADGIQIRGVDGLTLANCTLDLGPWAHGPDGRDALNAAFFTENANGGASNVRLRNSYLNGGGITWRSGGAVAGAFEVTDCDFGPDWRYAVQYSAGDRKGSLPTLQKGNRYLDKDGTWKPLILV